MEEDVLRYDEMVERALRDVVRQALTEVAENGLPGKHHFYLSFRTDAPGVEMPPALRAQHPEELTIVLQHQFWDLAVGAETFSVTVSFNQQPNSLTIPFSALLSFVDPSVNFGLQFNVPDAAGEVVAAADEKPDAAGQDAAKDDDSSPGGADVVTLDSFRKK